MVKTAAILDVAGGSEEPLRPLERVRIETARQDLAAGRGDRVVGTGQTGDAVQENDDILLVFDQPLGLFEHHFSDLRMALGRFVECRADDFSLHLPLPIGDFLRPFVDQQHDQCHFLVVLENGPGDGLQQHRLSGPGGRDDQPALAFPDRRREIHDAGAIFFTVELQLNAFFRIERCQVVEEDLVAGHLGVFDN